MRNHFYLKKDISLFFMIDSLKKAKIYFGYSNNL